jgi:hypothetical protein
MRDDEPRPVCGTREEPGTLTQGAPVFPGSSRLGIEPKTPGWLVQDPTTRPKRSAILSVGNQLEWLVCAWRISLRLCKR